MNPFDRSHPTSSDSKKLPVPDVERELEPVVLTMSIDQKVAMQKWLRVSSWIVGSFVIIVVAILTVQYVVSNTPRAMLAAATQHLAQSEGVAAAVTHEIHGKQGVRTITSQLLAYTNPTDTSQGLLQASLGQGTSRVGVSLRSFTGVTYMQFASLANMNRLLESAGQSTVSDDQLTRLASLDGQWYSFKQDDAYDLEPILSQYGIVGVVTQANFVQATTVYQGHQFLYIKQQQPDESLSGQQAMHVVLGIDQNKLVAYLRSVQSSLPSLRFSEQQLDEVANNQDLGSATLDVWIDRSTRTFAQFRLTRGSGAAKTITTFTMLPNLVATQRQSFDEPRDVLTAGHLGQDLQAIFTQRSAH